jgi:hypothetical protein
MKRLLVLGALAALLVTTAIPAGAKQADPTPDPKAEVEEPTVRYVLGGEARGLELGFQDQGLTLGAAVSEALSTPEAAGLGAGQCDLLGDGTESPEDLPCNNAATEVSSAPGHEGSKGETCASPPLPAPLDTVLELSVACGSSESDIVSGLPKTLNAGRIATLAAKLDLGGVSPDLDNVVEDVLDGIEEVIGQLPQPAQDVLRDVLATVDEGEAVRLNLGPTRSDIIPDGDTIEVVSTAKGAEIGLLGIPDLDQAGDPIPGTANALQDGLVTIEIGDAMSRAVLDRSKVTADAEADAALVRVKVLNITESPPVYEVIEVAPGETQTILQGTPLESTIVAADSQTDVKDGSARAASDAVSLHLLKGVEGGIELGLARTTAATTVAQEEPEEGNEPKPRQPTEPLPATGGTDFPVLLLVLGVALAAGILVARRLIRH